MQTDTLHKRGVPFARGKISSAAALSLLLFMGQTLPIIGNPTGGTVVAGSATIGPAGPTLTINQASTTAVINWQQFSIAGSETTKFLVPGASSATLNRVLGGNPSSIYGTLESNGILYLINPNGIVVGPNGRIDTAGFIGSTLDISNDEFLKRGNLHFLGTSDAGIENQGTIHASSGDVYLLAAQVTNSGKLLAPAGNVGLAAGTDILYQTAGDQHIFVKPTPAGTTRALGVTNSGTIRAASAELKAAGGNAYALAINNTGSIAVSGYKKIHGQVYLTAEGGDIDNSGQISANSAGGDGGTIVLNGYGSSSAGTVLNSGKLIAAGRKAGTTGGTVEMLGNRVEITDQGLVDVSGEAGGGTALIGGDEHGANPAIPDAEQTYLGPDATITAAALTYGNGGKVVLWGDQTTQAYGKISVAGGAQSGNGGFVETSAPSLDIQTVPDTSAPHGDGGTWLLDPLTIVITDGTDTGGNMTQGFTTSPPFTGSSTTLDASGSGATLNQSDLLTALMNGNVTLDASSGSGVTGTITWYQPNNEAFDISSIPGHTLTLNAPTSTTLSDITIESVGGTGSLNLTLNSSLTGAGSITVTGSTLNLNGGSFTANGNGYKSSSNANGAPDGIDIFGSTINAGGGNINLTGNGGYVYSSNVGPSGGLEAGNGVFIQNGAENAENTVIETSSAGNITIQGSYGQNLTTYGNATGYTPGTNGVAILGGSNGSTTTTLSVAQGTLEVNGTITEGTSGDGTSAQLASGFEGVDIEGASIEATGTHGAVSIMGSTAGTTVLDNATDGSGQNTGVIIGGNSNITAGVTISTGTDGDLTLNGTGGTIDSTFATSFNNTGQATGLSIATNTQITGGAGATVSLSGTGGTAVTDTGSLASAGTSYTGQARGIKIGDNSSQGGVAQITVGTGGSIEIDGVGGDMNISNDAAPGSNQTPGVQGTNISHGTLITASGTATITIQGTGGTVTAGSNLFGNASGVSIDGGSASGQNTVVSSDSGLITITGTGGTAPTEGFGVVVGGFDGATATVESTSGNIEITGTGGTGYSGIGFAEGNDVPNYGVVLADAGTLTTGGSGTISLTGTGGGNGSGGSDSNGVAIVELEDTTLDPDPVLPTINAGGAFTATAFATGILVNGAVTAASATLGTGTPGNYASITSGPLTIEGATITLAGGDFTALGAGLLDEPGGPENNVDGIDIISSTINTGGGSANLTGQASYFLTNNQGNAAGNGIFMTDSTLETGSLVQPSIVTGGITIQGNGSLGSGVSATTDLAGIYLDGSTVSVANGALSITGDVNSGTATTYYSGGVYSGGYARGVYTRDGTLLEATGSGSVTITGDSTGSSAEFANIGVDLTGEGFGSGNVPDPTVTSSVSAAGGLGISITGTAGAVNNSPSGTDVQTPSTDGIVVEFGAQITATGSAPITLVGTGGADQNLASDGLTNESSRGISLEAYDNGGGGGSPNILIQSEGGAISLEGTAGSSIGEVSGVSVDSEEGAFSTIQSVSVNGAPSGNITLTGSVPNQTADEGADPGSRETSATGVDITGDTSTSVYSSVNAALGSISLTGTVSSGSDNTKEAGVIISGGSQVTASGTGGTAGATAQGDVTIHGDTRGSTAESLDGGVFIEGAGTAVNATGVVADASGGTGLTITGYSSEIDGTTGATIDTDDNNMGGISLQPTTSGIAVINGATIATSGAAPMTLTGTGGLNDNTLNSTTEYSDPTTGATSGSYGVILFSPVSAQTTTIDAGGALSITGTAGSSPTTGIGIMIGGPSNLGIVSVTAGTSATLLGTGGAGNSSNTGAVPNAGVGIFNTANNSGSVFLTVGGGTQGITGNANGSSPIGILIEPSTSGVTTTSSTPVLESLDGALDLTSNAGIIFNAAGATGIPTATMGATFSSSSFVAIDGPVSDIEGLFLIQASSITLNAAISANDGNVVLVDTDQFNNDDGASALTASGGHTWQVWSVNPPNSGQSTVDNDDGLTPNFIQYDATYGVTTPAASGNGLLYSFDPSPLAVTLNGTFTKTYNGNENLTIAASSYTFSATGLLSGSSIGVLSAPALNGILNSKDVSTANSVSVTPSQINPDFSYQSIPVYGYTVGSVSGSATVTPATLTAGLTGTVSKVYDSTTAATLASINYLLPGVISGDTVTLNDPTSGTYDTKDVGTGKTVTVAGLALSGAQASDYMLASTTASGAVGSITPATLIAGLTGTVSKVYDSTTAATLASINYLLPGVYSGDTVTLNDPTSGTYNTKDVGTGKTVTVAGLALSGAQASDYTLASTTASGAVGTITTATLTTALTGTVDKTYDGTTTATLASANYLLPGVYSGDTVTLNDPTSGTYDTPNVGTGKTVTVTGLAISGPSAGDYALASTTVSGPVGEIDPASVSGSLTPYLGGTVTKVYDGTYTVDNLTSANYMLSGVMSGDSVTLTGPTTGTYASKDVGTGILVTSSPGLVLSGPQAGNYTLDSNTASGNIGIITPATLTASLTGAVSKVYDSTMAAALSSVNYLLPGVISGDTVTLNDPASGTYNTKDAGTGKTVTVTGLALSGAQANDYMLASTTASAAVGTITPATLTASLTGTVSKIYDSTTTAALNNSNYSLPGIFSGDTVALNDPTAGTYDTKDAGTGKTVAVTGLALSGAQAGDYMLASTGASGAVGIITTAPLTPSLTGTASKVYDGTTAGTLNPANVALATVFAGDSVSVSGSETYATPDAGVNESLTVSSLTLTGASAEDYHLNATTLTGNIGTTTAAPLTISADNATITPGSQLPTFDASYSGFAQGDSPSVLSGTLVFLTPATASSPDGNYSITPSGVSDPNYQIQFVPGTLTIGTVSTPTSTGTGGGNGSNTFPPNITPQPIQTQPQPPPPPTGNPAPAPTSYAGNGNFLQTGSETGSMADSSGNSGQVGSGDTAQLGNGELNNASNPVAAGALNEALGPAVHTALFDALKDAGDITSDFDDGSQDNEDLHPKNAKHTAGNETTLNGGDVVSIGSDGVQNIPLNQAPQPLKDALAGDVMHGMQGSAGH